MAAAAELLHNASLIHDDIQDHSIRRRERESLWVQFGSGIALSVGDLFISAASSALCQAPVHSQHLPTLAAHLHDVTRRCIRGQNDELELRAEAITMAHYERIVGAKSGALLGLPAELPLMAAGQERWCRSVATAARQLATAYQIIDDLDDIASDLGDASSDHRCLNVVAILNQQQVHDPRSEAARLARLRLNEAVASIDALPEACRLAFGELAERLRSRLPA